MKKVLKVLFVLIVLLAIVGGITFLIDASRAASGKAPWCAIEAGKVPDNGTKSYYGLGYRVIEFHETGEDGAEEYNPVKIGSWFMKYEDFQDEIDAFHQNHPSKEENPSIVETIPSGEEVTESGDVEESGDILVSGDQEPSGEETVSGETIETSGEEISAEPSGEEVTTTSGEEKEETSGETTIAETTPPEETEKTLHFKGTITGVKGNTLIVTADEEELVRASSDLFAVAKPDDGIEYKVNQRVEIEFTGDILEVYPAQINMTSIKVIE